MSDEVKTAPLTASELAARMNGREPHGEITGAEERAAKEAGLLVVFGYSDDSLEFRGVIDDEISCWRGGAFRIDNDGDGVVHDPERDRDDMEILSKYGVLEAARSRYAAGFEVRAKWAHAGYSWFIETDAPHAAFDIIEGSEKFCRGVVIEMPKGGVK